MTPIFIIIQLFAAGGIDGPAARIAGHGMSNAIRSDMGELHPYGSSPDWEKCR